MTPCRCKKSLRVGDSCLMCGRIKLWVAEIRKNPCGKVEYAIQFVGHDEGKDATWRETATVRTARKAIKSAVKLHNAPAEARRSSSIQPDVRAGGQ